MPETPDALAQAFADYLVRTNPPGERPQPGSERWRDLHGAFMAGATLMTDAVMAALQEEAIRAAAK